jgi:hypothetical protein
MQRKFCVTVPCLDLLQAVAAVRENQIDVAAGGCQGADGLKLPHAKHILL